MAPQTQPQNTEPKLQLGNFQQGLTHLRNIPTEQLYRLYVDGDKLKHEEGPMRYDRRYETENGSRNNENEILKALQGLLAPIQHGIGQEQKALEIPNELLKKIHFRIMHKNDGFYDAVYAGCMDGSGGFGMSQNNMSKEGLKQLLQRSADPLETAYRYTLNPNSRQLDFVNKEDCLNQSYTEEEIDRFYTTLRFGGGFFRTSGNDLDVEDNNYAQIMEGYTQNFIKQFEAVKNEGNVDEVIHTIVDYIQRCEQLHPFPDGNSRTFVNTMLCFCLMHAGLPPVIFDKPSVLDGHSVNEITAIVKEGCINTLRLINGEDGCHGFNHAEMMTLKKDDPHLKTIVMQSYDIKASLDELLDPILGENTQPVSVERALEIEQYKLKALTQEIQSLSQILLKVQELALTPEEKNAIAETIKQATTCLDNANITELFDKKMSLYTALDAAVKKNIEQVKRELENSSTQTAKVKSTLEECLSSLKHLDYSLEDRLLLGKNNHTEEKYFTYLTDRIEKVYQDLKKVTAEPQCQKIRARLQDLTTTYLSTLNSEHKNYALAKELKAKLESIYYLSFDCIDNFYQKLNEEDNLQSIKNDNTRSAAKFVLGIAVVAATIATGVLPGVLVMWATKKWPNELFNTHADTFGKGVAKEYKLFISQRPKNEEPASEEDTKFSPGS
ncbi:Fic family protein [Legionella rowbothamii]|uniref:Fic family protein n=1 Tax=Legionella rowbothamii TaxID=96229 RepID=UPI0010561AA4|nr:Fic family protein [Legionella rowbothamii]